MSVFARPSCEREKETGASEVYFAKCVGFPAIKIGCSHGWRLRLQALQTNLPFDLEFVGAFPGGMFAERFVQVTLLKHRLGGEYFSECDEVMEWAHHARDHAQPLRLIPHIDDLSWVREPKVRALMRRYKIAAEEVADLLQVGPSTAKKLTKDGYGKSRHFTAAVCVIAQRKGADLDALSEVRAAA